MLARRCLFTAFALLGLTILLSTRPAHAAEYPNVAALAPFSRECNYMSRAGYLRWMAFREQAVWLSMAEANRIVKAQSQPR